MTTALRSHSRLLWRTLLALGMAVVAITAQAADVTVRAILNRGFTVIGDPVQFQIKITGARKDPEPPEVTAEGLRIRYAGPSASSVLHIDNGVFTREHTLTHVYTVDADANGKYTIPAVIVEVDGKTYRTEPVGLTVQANPSGDDLQSSGFAEFVVPKKTLYVGETIPLELRLYVDARVRWQPVSMPDIPGEGFTKQKIPEPKHVTEDRNGREYDVLIFKTAITPSQAGKITIGPSEIPYSARIPRARRGPRSAFDMFDDDIFGDPMFSASQAMKQKAPAIILTVTPLPAAGQPRNFSGAVGNFEFSAEGSPKEVKIGDPLTMKMRISGRGSFDRITAPALVDEKGWRTYPPSSTYRPADPDDPSSPGTKTFEMAVLPETKKTAMPVFEFSYFDPLAEKYVTLKSAPAPLTVVGSSLPAVPPQNTGAGSAPDAANPPPAAAPKPNDILGQRYEQDVARNYAPLYQQRPFWYAQGGLGLALLALMGLRLRRRPDLAAREAARLRREKAAALARLRSAELDHVEFFETAARVAQIETALGTGLNAASIDAGTVRAAAPLSAETAAVIDEVFSSRAELLYAGGGRRDGRVAEPERERVLEALQELEKSHAHH